MKKIFFSLVAIAALAACAKSEVQYDEPSGEVGFTPVASNITKAALGVEDNTYPTTQNIGIWSNYDGDVAHGATVDYDTEFTVAYIEDKQFTYHTTTNPVSWAGVTPYYWPTNGSLVFAGYSMTAPTTAGTEAPAVGTSRSYNFSSDELKINGYTQSTDPTNTFDLLWFGRTRTSFNLRNQAAAVPVMFSHALSWITINVVGEGAVLAPNNTWAVTSVVINGIADKGNVTCDGSGANAAQWELLSAQDKTITVWTGSQPLESTAKPIENTDYGTLVIPQEPKTLTVKYTYKTPAGVSIEEETTVSLSLSGAKDESNNVITYTNWQSGTHYTYTLKFTQTEILVAPTVEGWAEVNQNVTVN